MDLLYINFFFISFSRPGHPAEVNRPAMLILDKGWRTLMLYFLRKACAKETIFCTCAISISSLGFKASDAATGKSDK